MQQSKSLDDCQSTRYIIYTPGSEEARAILSKATWKYVVADQGVRHISPGLWSQLEVLLLPMGSLLRTPAEGEEDHSRFCLPKRDKRKSQRPTWEVTHPGKFGLWGN